MTAIASGGRTRTFRARRDQDGAPVVLKVLALDRLSACRWEHDVLAALDVPDVVRTFGVVRRGDEVALVLEDIGGTSLADALGTLGLEEVLAIAARLASALAGVHEAGYVHQDVSPSNVVWSPADEQLRLIDFGLAARPGSDRQVIASELRRVEGTLAYLAPEQTGRTSWEVGPRTDLYALGGTLYHLLVGRPPFEATDPVELVHAHLAVSPPPPHQLDPAIPRGVSDIVMRLLRKSPSDRYQSARALAADLKRCVETLRETGDVPPFELGGDEEAERFELPAALYGRDRELDALRGALERTAAGAVEVVVVSGLSGSGKTALVQRGLRDAPGARYVVGKLEQHKGSIMFGGLTSALRGLVEHGLGADGAERERLLNALGPVAATVAQVVPEVELLVGWDETPPDVEAAEARRRLLDGLQRFVAAFETPRTPVVMFIDDVQWADPDTLSLLTAVASGGRDRALLMVLACRADEVGPDHALGDALAGMRQAGVPVTELELAPLGRDSVSAMVADAMRADASSVGELVDAVMARTDGNPFFVTQMLELLGAQGAIRFEPAARRFTCDLDAVRRTRVTADVAGLLALKLEQLPRETLRAVRLGAVVGARFEVGLVARAMRLTSAELSETLWPAVTAGILVPSVELEDGWAFAHDRIEEAAYSALPPRERRAAHLTVARALQAGGVADRRLFDAVRHFWLSIELVDDDAERREVVELARRASHKAREATAFDAAVRSLGVAADVLGDAGWEAAYDVTFDTHWKLAECLSLTPARAEALQVIEAAKPRVTSERDRGRLLGVEMFVLAFTGQPALALERGFEAARCLGCPLPSDPEDAAGDVADVLERLARLDASAIADIGPPTRPDVQELIRLLAALIAPTHFADLRATGVVAAHLVRLSLEHGLSSATAYGLSGLGCSVAATTGDGVTAHRLGRLALQTAELADDSQYRAATLFYAAAFCLPWGETYASSIDVFDEAIHVATELGDLAHLSGCHCLLSDRRLLSGAPLDVVREQVTQSEAAIRDSGNTTPLSFLVPARQLVDWLLGELPDGRTLDGPDFDEQESLEDALRHRNHVAVLRIMHSLVRHRYFAGAYPEMVRLARRARGVLSEFPSVPEAVELTCFAALSLAIGHTRTQDAAERESLAAELIEHEERLWGYARICPENYRHFAALVSSERARIEGRWAEAVELYDEAVAAAQQSGVLYVEAMAHELAARGWAARGKPEFALVEARRARATYEAWGAEVKVAQLDVEYPRAIAPAKQEDTGAGATTSTSRLTTDMLDLASVIRASQAISSEIDLEPLLATLVRVIMENAGATFAALILEEDGRRTVRAVADCRSGEGETLPGASVVEAGLPAHVVNTVSARRRVLVVADADSDERTRRDPVLQSRGVRSLLCAPIESKGELRGVMYLENDLTEGTFTRRRREALDTLLAQVAVSIDNATLFARQKAQAEELERYRNHLEELVEERTAELKATQGRLLEVSRLAGMAEVATSVLHNVGNALNSVNVSAELIDDHLAKLPLSGMGKASKLLAEQAPSLGPWFAPGQRGDKLLEYMRSLEATFADRVGRALGESRSLQERVEHVKVIISQQQAYGRMTTLVDDCSVVDLVSQAIAIVAPSCRAHGIALAVELADEQRTVRIDRHQVLQILVNLLTNARHAVADAQRPEGRIRLEVPAHDDRLLVRVTDNGVGIAADDLTRVFAHGFTKRKGGHGFGLHNAVLAARTMGGSLTCSSDGLGHGAEFVLDLPAIAEAS